MATAISNPFQKLTNQSHFISLNLYVGLLLQYQEHLAYLEEQIDALATEVDEYEIITFIPSIGNKIVNISFITTYSKSEFIILTSRIAALHAPRSKNLRIIVSPGAYTAN
ncbi:hypothetical protein D3C76_476460 [compost metagenome]